LPVKDVRVRQPVRLALIGRGRIFQVAHPPGLEKADGIQLVAVNDPSESVLHAVARRYEVARAYADATEAEHRLARTAGQFVYLDVEALSF
jgi:predicted dehydrogenase